MKEIFLRLGFSIADGPELEDDFHNFTALNFPPDHPARDMQDTFFIRKDEESGSDDLVMRTHTSPVQVRLMERSEERRVGKEGSARRGRARQEQEAKRTKN